jgi:WD40 repeat protein
MKPNESNSKKALACKSLAWSKSGTHLFAGWSDNHIRVYEIEDGAARTSAE